jgi:hypothetical protein
MYKGVLSDLRAYRLVGAEEIGSGTPGWGLALSSYKIAQNEERLMAVAIEDVLEAATNGVLRALEARKAGATAEDLSATALIRSGFYVDLHIIAGGITPLGASAATGEKKTATVAPPPDAAAPTGGRN